MAKLTEEQAADIRSRLDAAVEQSKLFRCNQQPEPPRPILNIVHNLPATLFGIPVRVECGEG